MTKLRLAYQTVEFGKIDIHLCTLRNRQEFHDPDGVAEFCATELGQVHCGAGRVRLLPVQEQESLGPAFARYLASKLWFGEE